VPSRRRWVRPQDRRGNAKLDGNSPPMAEKVCFRRSGVVDGPMAVATRSVNDAAIVRLGGAPRRADRSAIEQPELQWNAPRCGQDQSCRLPLPIAGAPAAVDKTTAVLLPVFLPRRREQAPRSRVRPCLGIGGHEWKPLPAQPYIDIVASLPHPPPATWVITSPPFFFAPDSSLGFDVRNV